MKNKVLNFYLIVFFLNLSVVKTVCAQNIYANSVTDSSADFQNSYKVADVDLTNYAYISNVSGVLNTSFLQASFAVSGVAGDAVNIEVQSPGQLSAGLLNAVTVKLYDSLGNNVANANGNSVLQLSLVSPGNNIYVIRYITDPVDTYKFKQVRVEFNNILSANLINEFRVYNFFYQPHCPPVLANSVYGVGTGTGTGINALLYGYVTNAGNAADASLTNYATLVDPLQALGLLGPSYLDLQFPTTARAGEYVGFAISQATSLLALSLIQNISIQAYDANNNLVSSRGNFTLSDIKALDSSSGLYTIGYTTAVGNYHISRLRITLNGTANLLEDLNVYYAFHYALNRPPVVITTGGTTLCAGGGNILLTAYDSLGSTNFLWSTGATTASITISAPGTYSVQVSDSESCTRYSIPITINQEAPVVPTITGDSVLCNGAVGTLHTSQAYSTYIWTGGSTNANTNVTIPGQYTVTVADSNGCSGSNTITVKRDTLNITANITNAACSNTNSGAINLVDNGSNNYSYLWSTGSTTASVSNLLPDLYTAIITDNTYNCTFNRAYTVEAAHTLTLKNAVTNTSGCNKNDGAAKVAVIGGSGNYTYSWGNGGTNDSMENLHAGIYYLTVTDNIYGCQQHDTIGVSDGGATQLIVNALVTPITTCNVLNGAISLLVTGGSGNYSYNGTNGITAATTANLGGGNYDILVSDNATQCNQVVAVNIGTGDSLHITGTVTNADCNGSNGGISAAVTNGSGLYNYTWSTGSTTPVINGLQSGTYKIFVHDNLSGCNGQQVFTVSETGGPAATITATNTSCNNNNDGSITVATTGTGYKYVWSNGSHIQNQADLSPGIYTVAIIDTVSGCSSVYAATVNPASQISLVANVTPNSSCSATSANGSLSVVATSGVNPYTYNWSNGATAPTDNNLSAGTYTVTVTGGNGCSNSLTAIVPVDSSNIVHVIVDSILQAACSSSATGGAILSVTGGTAPYTYSWGSGMLGLLNLNNVLPGNYNVTVTDANGCTGLATVNIITDTTNEIHIAVDSVIYASCSGSADGGAVISVTGGAGPYTYSWSNGMNGILNLSNVLPGIYTLTVADANGCTATASINITTNPNANLMITVNSVTNTACINSTNGGATVSVTGGSAPYIYAWSNGSGNMDLSGAGAGTYHLTVTDAHGCTDTASVTIVVDTALSIHLTATNVTQSNCSNTGGSATVIATGGTAPYIYSWSNGAGGETLTNAAAGIYTLTVTDAGSCNASISINITQDTVNTPNVTINSVTQAACTTAMNGGAATSVTGGTAPYTYSWSNGTAMEDLSGVQAGVYTLTVTDAHGCTATASVNITVDSTHAVAVVIDSVVNAGCSNTQSGAVYAHAYNGISPYSYMWTNNGMIADLTDIGAGTYTITVTDAAGCMANATATVSGGSQLNISLQTTGVSCYGGNNGAITAAVSDGSGNYTYSWNTGSTNSAINNLIAGSYTLTVTDAQTQCTQSAAAQVSQPDSLIISVTTTDVLCAGNGGTATIAITGGTRPYTISWSDGIYDSQATGLMAGSYIVTVTDINMCQRNDHFNIGAAACDSPIVIHNVITPNGDGINDMLVIEGIDKFPNNMLTIFDKWGDVVYQCEHYNNTWTGTNKHNTPLSAGTYYYLLKLNAANTNGIKTDYTGYIMVQQ